MTDYLIALYKKESVKYDAILTDGIHIAYFQFIGDNVRSTSLRSISVDDIDRVIRAILNNQSKKFKSVNIVKDFSISSKSDSSSKKLQTSYMTNFVNISQRNLICSIPNGRN